MGRFPCVIRRGAAPPLHAGACAWLLAVLSFGLQASAESPAPVLNNVFPAGGQAGSSVLVSVEGPGLEGLTELRFRDSRMTAKKEQGNQFRVTIPVEATPGFHDVRVLGTNGISGPRAFVIGQRVEVRETEPNETLDQANPVAIDSVCNGRFEKPGDLDCFAFEARAGQCVVLDMWAARIDSTARGVMEVYDSDGRRLAVNRGRHGIDPRIDFVVPADGTYRVKLFDQTYSGGNDAVYRLEIDAGPRVDFVTPAVVSQDGPERVTLFGRNLLPRGTAAGSEVRASGSPDQFSVEIVPSRGGVLPLPLRANQSGFDGFQVSHPGGGLPATIGLTDVPVVRDAAGNHRPEDAQELTFPCEVSGQLADGDERDWFAVSLKKGEVLWLEAFGERIGSPVDLELAVLAADRRELLRFADEPRNVGGMRFPTNHSDPSGRFVAPEDGRYLVMLQNVIGGLESDPRRLYRLSVRREEPDFHVTLVPRRTDLPTGLNVPRSGRERCDLFVVRRRGMTGPIRITADDLPPGVECPDVWIGPGQSHGTLVFAAGRETPVRVAPLTLTAHAELFGDRDRELVRPVRGGTMVRANQPTGWGRMTDEIPLALAPEAALFVSATPVEANVFQESILDVAVDVERRTGCDGPIQIAGVGLPDGVESPVATIPAEATRGWLSFAIPASLPPGPFTFAIQADTDLTVNKAKSSVTTFSNPVTLRVAPARLRVTIDPRTPRKIARGKVIHVKYKAERLDGFIGKVHTELAAPGGVVGIRGRGVTFTGQTETGDIQIIATDVATPGRLAFLRLEAVGTVEDQPTYRGSRFLELEIVE